MAGSCCHFLLGLWTRIKILRSAPCPQSRALVERRAGAVQLTTVPYGRKPSTNRFCSSEWRKRTSAWRVSVSTHIPLSYNLTFFSFGFAHNRTGLLHWVAVFTQKKKKSFRYDFSYPHVILNPYEFPLNTKGNILLT